LSDKELAEMDGEAWVQTIIPDILREKMDPKLYSQATAQLCYQDFQSFIRFIDKPGCDSKTREKFNIAAFGDVNEVREAIGVFIGTWLKKFIERVREVPEPPKKNPHVTLGEQRKKQFSERELSEVMDEVIRELVQNGEICATQLLAKNLLEGTLGYGSKQALSFEEKISLVEKLKRKARELSRTHGPLIFMFHPPLPSG